MKHKVPPVRNQIQIDAATINGSMRCTVTILPTVRVDVTLLLATAIFNGGASRRSHANASANIPAANAQNAARRRGHGLHKHADQCDPRSML